MEWQNQLTGMLGIAYPFIQAPMLGITTPAMVAAVSNSGGLGSLPVGGLAPEKVTALIREVKTLTDKPFAVNLFTYEPPVVYNEGIFHKMQEFLQFLYGAHQIAAAPVAYADIRIHSYRDQVPALLAEGISLVSFTFGMPDAATMATLRAHHCRLMGTATSVGEALALEMGGVDVIIAQGIEAGGHRGTFLPGRLPQVSTMALVPQIVDRVRLPVVAAGGIADGRGVAAAFKLGAAGVQVGSAFLRSKESAATKAHKDMLAKSTDTGTRLTRAFSGRWARGIPNLLMEEIEASGLMINEYPVQDQLTQPIRKVAKELDNPAFIVMYAGQCAHHAKALPAADIFKEIITAAEQV